MPLPNQKALEQGNLLVTLGPKPDRFKPFFSNTEIADQSRTASTVRKTF